MEFSTGYLTVAQVCAILTIDRSTLYRMRKDGEFIEAVDITGGRIGFPIPEFSAWKLKREQARGGPRRQRGLIRCRPPLPAWKLQSEEPRGGPPNPRGGPPKPRGPASPREV
ncbi:helix-turn-helix transcriptional regulator [Rhizobium laguerreae]|uniref:helix-turn-helix transcriptional regulator n=1 Tax=Rhizobium laguerreae TaxID=1076926 RepID=UPI0014424900|nr:helix-turn-helix domain-containing protein [Rhizobium laguerreae]